MAALEERRFNFSEGEAIAWLRRAPARTRFYTYVWVDVFDPTLKREQIMRTVPLSRASAIQFVKQLLNAEQTAAGWKIQCFEYTGCTYTSYWIG
jgi:hypothetical protein